jgi:hypothetical protein
LKGKISATVQEPLLDFLDSLPGRTRSEKLERVLALYKEMHDDRRLREQLSGHREDEDEQREREAWARTFEETMWSE